MPYNNELEENYFYIYCKKCEKLVNLRLKRRLEALVCNNY